MKHCIDEIILWDDMRVFWTIQGAAFLKPNVIWQG